MNVCMIVHNSGTRDGRVMREAHTLQAAGHQVTIIGIPESSAHSSEERLADGVRISRVEWYREARRRFRRSGIPRAALFAAVCAGLAYGLYRLAWAAIHQTIPLVQRVFPALAASDLRQGVAIVAASSAVLTLWYAASATHKRSVRRSQNRELMRRRMISIDSEHASNFPRIQTRIPHWIPDWVLEMGLEPLGWLGAKTARFSFHRYRSEELAAAAIRLKPDVVHCHDCLALPTGWLVKKALAIPLVYDAHEIYEAVASRRPGVTDYFGRVHEKYLPLLDGFIAVNDSAANYYRYAYPGSPRAVVIRNAMERAELGRYDGRLHYAAGLPLGEKILIYQGGFSKLRGLETLVRAGALLPAGWSLVMMGSGALEAELKLLAAAGAGGTVKFLPAVPQQDLLSWTQGATAGIVPYEDKVLNHWIATPNKLWEYPNAGVPMIVQPFFEMRRIVETYGCGWPLPEQFTPEGIANLVGSLTEGKLAVARDGCRRFIAQDNWSSVYQPRLLQLYKDLEGRNQRRRQNPDAIFP